MSALGKDDYSLWRVTKGIRRPKLLTAPLRNATGSWARTEAEKAELFADHLEQTFQSHPGAEDVEVDDFLGTPVTESQPIELTNENEVRDVIKYLKQRKSPGYDLITSRILKELPEKAVEFLTRLFNAIMSIGYFPLQWKAAEIIMIQKPGKSSDEIKSYRPISLLPALGKVFEKILIRKLQPILKEKKMIPDHQFGFRRNHSTVEQVHRVVKTITNTLEKKECCSAAFLDIEAAFDRVWHDGLRFKIRKLLPSAYYNILRSYIGDRFMQVRYGEATSTFRGIRAGVPQGSVLGPILYTIYTSDIPALENVIVATFADDTAILATNKDNMRASEMLQEQLDETERWLRKWRIKASTTKSVHATFTMKKVNCPPVTLNGEVLPESDTVKYLGLHLDRRLTWKQHVRAKRAELNQRLRGMYWLLGRASKLSVHNKLLVYKAVLKPVWTYGLQLWGTTANSNVEIIQRFQNKCLRMIVSADWFHRNDEIHSYVDLKTVKEEIIRYSESYEKRLNGHSNWLAIELLDNSDEVRRLKRKHVLDLF